ncbi:MAG: thiamine pyrophosphate-dependent enzyme [candidate division KSB1 bacterium]|nr:thiamine pyrophosphate-dependent enzyme [candidate division KSB1 bacterium]
MQTTGRVTTLRREVSGEEALALGAFRAGVQVVCGFPGRPGARTLQLLAAAGQSRGVTATWNVSPVAAVEEAVGASLLGRRVLVCLPGSGLATALDALLVAATTGTNAGLVLLAGDDPGTTESSAHVDARTLAALASVPVLEPATPAQGAEMVEEAFRLSEEYQLPVVVRIVPAYARMRGEVVVEKLVRTPGSETRLAREPGKWVATPSVAAERRERLLWKWERIAEGFSHSLFNEVTGAARRAVVAVGHVASEVSDIVGDLAHGHFTLCSLGTPVPLPAAWLAGSLQSTDEVAVLEEGAPVVEQALVELVHRRKLNVEIKGRYSGLVPGGGELFRWQIEEILSQFEPRFAPARPFFPYEEKPDKPKAEKGFCTGCPHVHAFRVLKQVLRAVFGDAPPIIVGDPGCTMRAAVPPLSLVDVSYNLGAAISLAKGLARQVSTLPVIAVMGDTAFFAWGINSLIEAAREKAQLIVVIFDNQTSATTGFQPNPGSTYVLQNERFKRVALEELISACGVDLLRVVDPENETRTRQVFSEALTVDGLRVVVLRSPCPLIP